MTIHDPIISRINEHLKIGLHTYSPHEWFVIALQGSQNYQMADENSDIDTKMLFIPTVEDCIFKKKPISHTVLMDNDEHVDCKDVHLYFNTFRKQNINFVEILFTNYALVNPIYKEYWERLVDNNEKIARMNPLAAIKCMCGMAHQKAKDLTHEFQGKKALIEQYGYDAKQLCHVLRLKDFLERYIAGESYKDCLVPREKNKLLAIKRYDAGIDLSAAKELATEAVARMDLMVYDYEHGISSYNIDKEADKLLDTILYDIMIKHFSYSLA